jgi:DNA polymerase III alpha subunit (gram-positive type)
MTELFCSFDIETDGPCPGLNSMLSLGAVVLDQDGAEVAAYYNNFQPLPEATQDLDTMAFWAKFPEAYEQTLANRLPPKEALEIFLDMLYTLRDKHKTDIALLAYPAGFDFSFLYYYMRRFVPRDPVVPGLVGFNCIDMRSFIMGMTGRPFFNTQKGRWPNRWHSKLPHTHNALDDAREQGDSFIKILKEARDRAQMLVLRDGT